MSHYFIWSWTQTSPLFKPPSLSTRLLMCEWASKSVTQSFSAFYVKLTLEKNLRKLRSKEGERVTDLYPNFPHTSSPYFISKCCAFLIFLISNGFFYLILMIVQRKTAPLVVLHPKDLLITASTPHIGAGVHITPLIWKWEVQGFFIDEWLIL